MKISLLCDLKIDNKQWSFFFRNFAAAYKDIFLKNHPTPLVIEFLTPEVGYVFHGVLSLNSGKHIITEIIEKLQKKMNENTCLLMSFFHFSPTNLSKLIPHSQSVILKCVHPCNYSIWKRRYLLLYYSGKGLTVVMLYATFKITPIKIIFCT